MSLQKGGVLASVKVWDPNTLEWVAMTQPSGGSGGGGGDASAANQTTEISKLTSIDTKLSGPIPVSDNGGSLTVDGPLTDGQLRANPVPVSGTFWQATQPVSGPLTDTQLRAAAVPVSLASVPSHPVTGTFWQATQPVSAASLPLPTGAATETTLSGVSGKLPASLGQKNSASSMSVVLSTDQPTVPVSFAAASALFKGRASIFRTPGRAGTTGQKILSLFNAGGSSVTITVNKVVVDLMQTVVKAITVAPPLVRLWKVTAAPTNGTSLTKNKIGGSSTSNASVTVLGDASADGTNSGTALTATLPAGAILTQEFAPRFITAAGYEPADRMEFFGDSEVTLAASEGVVLFLDYTLATQNPTTDMWIASIEWSEN